MPDDIPPLGERRYEAPLATEVLFQSQKFSLVQTMYFDWKEPCLEYLPVRGSDEHWH